MHRGSIRRWTCATGDSTQSQSEGFRAGADGVSAERSSFQRHLKQEITSRGPPPGLGLCLVCVADMFVVLCVLCLFVLLCFIVYCLFLLLFFLALARVLEAGAVCGCDQACFDEDSRQDMGAAC